ncbi:MAG: PDZ domain-containing protein [Polyangiaceae bacterium]
MIAVALVGCFGSSAPEVGSIGAVLSRDGETGRVYVHDVASSSAPGVLPGDEIVMIDGVFARDLDAEQLRKHLRGAPGSKVQITIVRSGHALRLELNRVALRNTFVPKTETVTP